VVLGVGNGQVGGLKRKIRERTMKKQKNFDANSRTSGLLTEAEGGGGDAEKEEDYITN